MSHVAGEWVPLFPGEEIPFLLDAVLRCCAALQKKHSNEHENWLTKRLYRLLQKDAALRTRALHVDIEVSVLNEESGDEAKEGRLDLRFLFSTATRHPWPYFAIEAKRLHVTFPSGFKSLVTDYVTGDQGMMCFITQRYANMLDKGAMLGYVFDGKTTDARKAVSQLIADNKALLNATSTGLVRSANIPGNVVFESVHSTGGQPAEFIIYHLFIAV